MTAINTLTDKSIRAKLKEASGAGAPLTITDGGGLSLICRPDGVGWWRIRYWIDSREGRLSVGTYPEVSLADARQRRDEARRLVAAGINPSEQRKASKADRVAKAEAARLADAGMPGPGSFEYVAREWMLTIHRAKVSNGHADRTLIRFEQDVFPWIGAISIAEIKAPLLLEVLRRIIGRGAIETAHRAKDACGQVFRYGIATSQCEGNPAADLKDALPPVPTRHHAAIIDPKQAGDLLRSMLAYEGHPVTRAALALSALLLLRPGELRQLEWTWVDLDAMTITLPGAIMKRKKDDKANGPPHIVPLAPQALTTLRDLQSLTGKGRFVFRSIHTGERCMSDGTVNVAIRRMGYDKTTMTAHGFRAMARTLIAERLGIDPQVIEAQLAHAVPDSLGRAYNRTQFIDQRRDMMTKWADYLDLLRKGHPERHE